MVAMILLKLWRSHWSNFFDQSIYSWRVAYVESMSDFVRQFQQGFNHATSTTKGDPEDSVTTVYLMEIIESPPTTSTRPKKSSKIHAPSRPQPRMRSWRIWNPCGGRAWLQGWLHVNTARPNLISPWKRSTNCRGTGYLSDQCSISCFGGGVCCKQS